MTGNSGWQRRLAKTAGRAGLSFCSTLLISAYFRLFPAYLCLYPIRQPNVFHLTGLLQKAVALPLLWVKPVPPACTTDPAPFQAASRALFDFAATVGRTIMTPDRIDIVVIGQRARQFVAAAADDVSVRRPADPRYRAPDKNQARPVDCIRTARQSPGCPVPRPVPPEKQSPTAVPRSGKSCR